MKNKSLLLFVAGTLLLSGCSKAEKLEKYKTKVSNEVFFEKLNEKIDSHQKLASLKEDPNFKNPFSYTKTYVYEESSKTKVFLNRKKLYKDEDEINTKGVDKYNKNNVLYSRESESEIEIEREEKEEESTEETYLISQVDSETNSVDTFMPNLNVYCKNVIENGNPKENLKNEAMSDIKKTLDGFYSDLQSSKEDFEKKIGYNKNAKTNYCNVDKNEFYIDKNNSVFTIVLESNKHDMWEKEHIVKDVYQLVIENDKVLFIYNSDVKKSRDNKKVDEKIRSSTLVEFNDPKIKKQDAKKYLLMDERDKENLDPEKALG